MMFLKRKKKPVPLPLTQKVLEITAEKLIDIDNEATIIDVRDKTEYKLLERIDNSKNVPLIELLNHANLYLPDKSAVIVTICNAGNRSTEAAMRLREMGYINAYVLDGGIYRYTKVKNH